MKYGHKKYAIDKEELERLQRRVDTFRERLGGERSVHLTMITPNGLERNMFSHAVQSEVTMDALFR